MKLMEAMMARSGPALERSLWKPTMKITAPVVRAAH
jgi:hypothetical protein